MLFALVNAKTQDISAVYESLKDAQYYKKQWDFVDGVIYEIVGVCNEHANV